MQDSGRGLVKREHAGVVHMRVEHDGVVIPRDHEVGVACGTLVALAGDVQE
jgi:hypothetical protein